MPYTVSKVRHSRPEALRTAAGDAEISAQRIEAQICQGLEQMNWLKDDRIGRASDAAGKQYGELITYQRAYSDQLRAVTRALGEHGPKRVHYKAKLDTAVAEAENLWNIADNGSVSPGVESAQHRSDTYYFEGIGWLSPADVAAPDASSIPTICGR